MITALVFGAIFAAVNALVMLLPNGATRSIPIADLFSLLELGFAVFPWDLFAFCVSNVVFWLGLQMTWAIIEWIYKKIPGVN